MANLSNELNAYLANLNVMAQNVRNMHWNVIGPYFTALHLATGKIYKDLACQIDEVAEMMKMQQMQPLARLSDYINEATIEELDARDYNEYELIDNMVAGGQELMKQAKEIRDTADDDDNFLVANKFEEYLCCYAKMEWMVRAMHIDEYRRDQDDEDDDDEDDD